jgi:hypothetical protein
MACIPFIASCSNETSYREDLDMEQEGQNSLSLSYAQGILVSRDACGVDIRITVYSRMFTEGEIVHFDLKNIDPASASKMPPNGSEVAIRYLSRNGLYDAVDIELVSD